MVSQYGILLISVASSKVWGQWSFEKQIEESIGVVNGLKSMKLNCVSIESMQDNLESEIICTSKSLVVLIPNNQLASPKSVKEYFSFNLSL